MIVLKIAVPVPLRRTFDYLWDAPVAEGSFVVVRFAGRKLVGIVVGNDASSDVPPEKLRRIEQVLHDRSPVTPTLMQLCHWLSVYYFHPFGEVLTTALPNRLTRIQPVKDYRNPLLCITAEGRQQLQGNLGARQRALLQFLAEDPREAAQIRSAQIAPSSTVASLLDRGWIAEVCGRDATGAAGPVLNDEQADVIGGVDLEAGFRCHLLFGVTGSGKTEVYLSLAERLAEERFQCLLLVPEIGLTPQLIERVRARMGPAVAALHSHMSDIQRLIVWNRAHRGELRVVVGTRSALFTPMPRLGLIVVDEEHDQSFKQADGLRYSARDAAIKRAQLEDIPIVLGSATPSLESYANASRGVYRLHRLTRRATGAVLPEVETVDLRALPIDTVLAPKSLGAMREELEKGRQVMVFMNRRGYAPVLLCRVCAWVSECPRCDARTTVHKSSRRLICHHCGWSQRNPDQCPSCDSANLIHLGFGTERIEECVRESFPGQGVERLDRDVVTSADRLEQALGRIRSGTAEIILGTQMLAKGHDFPRVSLVIVANMDQSLFSVDFRAAERSAQMMTQISGRAGRSRTPGKVLVQTHQPQHPLLLRLFTQDYQSLAAELLQERQATGFPPATFMIVVRAEARSAKQAEGFLRRVSVSGKDDKAQVFGPLPAIMERVADRYRWQLILQATDRHSLRHLAREIICRMEAIRGFSSVRWSVDVDPQEPV